MDLEDIRIDRITISQEDLCSIVSDWFATQTNICTTFEVQAFDDELTSITFERKTHD